MLHLVLGGARSGKSSFAEQAVLKATTNAETPIYIATAQALDKEMQRRITHHQQLRQQQKWLLIECPINLATTLQTLSADHHVLVDCLTLWLSNQLTVALNQDIDLHDFLEQEVASLLAVLNQHPANITLVSNEIGLGVVPMGAETRAFVDHQGWMNQKIAQLANKVTLVTAGIPLILKAETTANG